MNTYLNFNSDKENYQHKDSNDILLNIISVDKTNEWNNAFTMRRSKKPSHIVSLNQIPELLKNTEFFEKNDVAEVLRGDYCRLYFDIDCHTEEEMDDAFKAFELVFHIVKILAEDHDLEPVEIIGGYAETKHLTNELIQKLYDDYDLVNGDNFVIIETEQPKAKYFSSHLYLRSFYFSRNALYNLFKDFNSKQKKLNSNLPETLDTTVYVRGQRIFRFPFSGKAISGRGIPCLTDYAFEVLNKSPDVFIATKTENDTNFISENSQTYDKINNYLQTFMPKIEAATKKENKKYIEELSDKIKNNDTKIKHNVLTHTPQSEWYFNLIKQIQKHIYFNPEATKDEIIKHFSKEEYRYITQVHKNKILNVSAIISAYNIAKENPLSAGKLKKEILNVGRIESKDMMDYFKFRNIVTSYKGVDYVTLAQLIHSSFAFFTRTEEEKTAINFIAFKTVDGIIVQSFEAFKKQLDTTPVTIRINEKGKIYECDITKAFKFYDKYKSRYYDFELASEREDVLSLYTQPTQPTHIEQELPDEVDKIFDLYATVYDPKNDGSYVNTVDQERKEYIINWFAYMLQNPAHRNLTCLQLSAAPGIGKNLITNTICQYLKRFSWDNANIDNIIGTYNGGVDKKLFIVMNEIDTSNHNKDKLKSTITDPKIPINEKYGQSYMGKNCANYLMFTNHFDTQTISENDRRFAFIHSTAKPYPKDFYNSIVNPLTSSLKDDLAEKFINYLLSKDLTGYDPSFAPTFDKDKIYKLRSEKRSAVYRFVVDMFNSNSPELVNGVIIVEKLLNDINEYLRFAEKSLSEKYGLTDNLDDDIFNELSKKNITTRTIQDIINFNDEDPYVITKCYKSFARKKLIIMQK